MKKMFTLVMTLLVFSVLFAQRDKPYGDDRNAPLYNGGYNDNDMNRRPDHGIEIQRNSNEWQSNGYNNQDDYSDRKMAGDYNDRDRRMNDYGNDTRMNGWARERSADQFRKQRADKLKAFGGGVLLGGILGVLIGTER